MFDVLRKNAALLSFFSQEPNPLFVEKEYKIEVSITQGGLVASIKVTPLTEVVSSINMSDLHESLHDAGVTFGIWSDVLHQIAENKTLNKWVTVAKGEQPGEGKDGYVLCRFNKDGLKATLKEDLRGRVNIKDMNLIQNVAAGDVLCELVPPETGNRGTTVKGEEIAGKIGSPGKLPTGKGIEISPDGNKIVAAIDGMVVWSDSEVNVEPVYVVDKVDSSTGNVRFNGSVVVNGEVGDGYEVHAQENVTVAMSVGRVIITAGGNIRIAGGILGQEKAQVTAQGSLHVKFIQDAQVRARKEIVVEDYIRNSEVTSGGPVVVRSPQGWISGCSVSSEAWIYCHTIGHEANPVSTRLIIGHNPALLHERELSKKDLTERIGDFLKLQASLGKLRILKTKGALTKQQEVLYTKILDAIETVKHNLYSIDSRIHDLTEQINAVFSGNIYIDGVANEGTIIMIGKAVREVEESRVKTQFSLRNNEIVETEFVMLPEIKEFLEAE